mgnify:CR=1 FL=1
MKILNGNKYYERADVAKFNKFASLSLVDPSILQSSHKNMFGFDVDFLYSADSDELDVIKSGIKKFNNTISWEFSTESALNLSIIEKCYQSLRTPASNKMDFKSFKQLSATQINHDCLSRYENWLCDVGVDILFFFFVRK